MQGTFSDSAVGYISEVYLPSPLSKYRDGQVLNARVLYLEPMTKIVQFTLGNLQDRSESDFQKGAVTSAQVMIATNLFSLLNR